jgi:flagellar export protein FliJ
MSNRDIHKQLVRVRRWQRDQQVVQVQGTERAINVLKSEIEQLALAISQWSDARRALQSGIIKLNDWRENETHRNELLRLHEHYVQELDELSKNLNEQRAVLLEREKSLRQVEKLYEVRLEHQAEQLRLDEQATLDDWSGVQARISRTTRP